MFLLFELFLGLALALHGSVMWSYYKRTRDIVKNQPAGSLTEVIKYLILCSEAYRKNSPFLNDVTKDERNSELREAVHLIVCGAVSDPNSVRNYFTKWETDTREIASVAQRLKQQAQVIPYATMLVAVGCLYWIFVHIGAPGFQVHLMQGVSWAFFAATYGLTMQWAVSGLFKKYLLSVLRMRNYRKLLIQEALKELPLEPNPIFLAEKLNALVPDEFRLEWEKVFEMSKKDAA